MTSVCPVYTLNVRSKILVHKYSSNVLQSHLMEQKVSKYHSFQHIITLIYHNIIDATTHNNKTPDISIKTCIVVEL